MPTLVRAQLGAHIVKAGTPLRLMLVVDSDDKESPAPISSGIQVRAARVTGPAEPLPLADVFPALPGRSAFEVTTGSWETGAYEVSCALGRELMFTAPEYLWVVSESDYLGIWEERAGETFTNRRSLYSWKGVAQTLELVTPYEPDPDASEGERLHRIMLPAYSLPPSIPLEPFRWLAQGVVECVNMFLPDRGTAHWSVVTGRQAVQLSLSAHLWLEVTDAMMAAAVNPVRGPLALLNHSRDIDGFEFHIFASAPTIISVRIAYRPGPLATTFPNLNINPTVDLFKQTGLRAVE